MKTKLRLLRTLTCLLATTVITLSHIAYAEDTTEEKTPAVDVIQVKQIGMELAMDIARESVLACRAQGYNVAAVVVDRTANVTAVLRDTLASHFTIQIANEKANAVVLSGVDSSAFRASRTDIKDEMNQVEGILVLDGGIKIMAGGSTLGAVGVSGAPGGEKDEACARKALEKLSERLEFLD